MGSDTSSSDSQPTPSAKLDGGGNAVNHSRYTATSVDALDHDGLNPARGVVLPRVAGADAGVRVWDARSGRCARHYVGHAGAVTALLLDDRHIFSGGRDASVRVWPLAGIPSPAAAAADD